MNEQNKVARMNGTCQSSGSTCHQCGGVPTLESDTLGHSVRCSGCGAHGVIDCESRSLAWYEWAKFNASNMSISAPQGADHGAVKKVWEQADD